jgi:predicted phosphodiesterase
VDVLNALPGTPIPEVAGGGVVGEPRGVIHAGDLIDSGDKNGAPFAAMAATEWDAYVKDFGLTGKDGRLKFPVYDVHGNHDSPGGKGGVIDGLVARNRRRPGVANVSGNGLHYSWDWGPVHLICLGIVVGGADGVARRRRYNPLNSLPFLVEDLKAKVGGSGRPVVITHHVDVARYTGTCDPDGPYENKEWDACDVRAFHEAVRGYNVAAVLYGHTHTRNVLRWDGATARAAEGIDLFNVDNSSHFNSDTQGVLYFHLKDGRLTVREYATRDRWVTGAWTPQVWARAVAVPVG